jgi:hypothetical protein
VTNFGLQSRAMSSPNGPLSLVDGRPYRVESPIVND